jgi:rsbT co-antagonist protein RsbR
MMTHDETEIRRLLERYAMAIAVAGDGLWEYPAIDPEQAFHRDIPVHYSERFTELLGYPEGSLPQIASSWWDAIHPEDLAKSSKAIAAHFMTGKPIFAEYRVINREGEIRWWQVFGDSMPDAERKGKIRAIGVVRDITALKVAEETARNQLELVTRQQRAMRALSTPIIQLWEDIITLPLVGAVNSERASAIMDRLLSEVVRLRARYAIMDMTGVDTVDTTTAEQLYRIMRAVGLLGGQVRLSGLNPAVARTMTNLGVDVTPFVSHRNLQDALQACLRDSDRLVMH